jgi:hypothetical protein
MESLSIHLQAILFGGRCGGSRRPLPSKLLSFPATFR